MEEEKVKRPTSTRWRLSKPNKAISLTSQLQIEAGTNFLRNARRMTRDNKEAADRIENLLLSIRVFSDMLGIPQWRFYDILLSKGLSDWLREHWDTIQLLMKQREKREESLKRYIQLEEEIREDHADFLKQVADEMTDQAFEGAFQVKPERKERKR